MINGLEYHPEFLLQSEQTALQKYIDEAVWLNTLKRRVQHYGYLYDYRKRAIDPSMYLGNLPDWITMLILKIVTKGVISFRPDQAIINEYLPGQGIAAHVDCEPCFGDTVLSLSLGSACVMDFINRQTGEKVQTLLEPGSLLLMRGEARYEWTHGIAARKTDPIDGKRLPRQRRISITLRKVVLSEELFRVGFDTI